MSDDNFKKGLLEYEIMEVADIGQLPRQFDLNGKWDDGFAAFSRGELTWNDIPEEKRPCLWTERIGNNLKGAQGYLMELNLWRQLETAIEEICIEREDHGFVCQRWCLKKAPKGEENCYYREAATLVRPPISEIKQVFQKLETIEVIQWKHRLHFFLTKGGKA